MSERKTLSAPVPPGATIGILGGGQLGRMLALAAARLGLKTHIYSDEANPCAFDVAAETTTGKYDDAAALEKFARACAAVTFEFENVPSAAIETVARFAPANPGARALNVAQDRLAEKNFARELGLHTPPFFEVNSPDDARVAFSKLHGKGVLKTRRLGYDGKGQAKVASAEECASVYSSFKGAPAILEGFVDFAFEASVIAARGMDGSFAAYDPPENLHRNHILKTSTVPSRLRAAQITEAKNIAQKMAAALDYVGVFAVELFVTKDAALLINEIAPRVHNSGHWTIEACAVSQFEQHIRAIAGWPLGDASRHSNAVMENIIGIEANDWLRLSKEGALHLYGKGEARPGRKMGHITRLSPKS